MTSWFSYIGCINPIFHWKLCSCWLPNASESDTNKMKSKWPTQECCVHVSLMFFTNIERLTTILEQKSKSRHCETVLENVDDVTIMGHDGLL